MAHGDSKPNSLMSLAGSNKAYGPAFYSLSGFHIKEEGKPGDAFKPILNLIAQQMGPFKMAHHPELKEVPMVHEGDEKLHPESVSNPSLLQVVVGLPHSKSWKRHARTNLSGLGNASTSDPFKKRVGDGLAGGIKKRPRMENEDDANHDETSTEAEDQPRRDP